MSSRAASMSTAHLAISHWMPWKSAMVLPKAARCWTYSVAYMSAPSASPMPRAATTGRMELSPSMARRNPPTSPMTLLGRDAHVGEQQLAGVDAAHPHLVVGAADLDAGPGAARR